MIDKLALLLSDRCRGGSIEFGGRGMVGLTREPLALPLVVCNQKADGVVQRVSRSRALNSRRSLIELGVYGPQKARPPPLHLIFRTPQQDQSKNWEAAGFALDELACLRVDCRLQELIVFLHMLCRLNATNISSSMFLSYPPCCAFHEGVKCFDRSRRKVKHLLHRALAPPLVVLELPATLGWR